MSTQRWVYNGAATTGNDTGAPNPISGCENPKMGPRYCPMQESSLEFVVTNLNLDPGRSNWDRLGEAADVPGATIEKIARGYVTNPRYETVEKLAKYIRENPAQFSKRRRAS